LGNTSNDWNSVIRARVWRLALDGSEELTNGSPGFCDNFVNAGSDAVVGEQYFGTGATFEPGSVVASLSPTQNFNLAYWKITYPDATEEDPPQVVDSEFYTDPTTGAMVFQCPNQGQTTSSSTRYSRTELREMLRLSPGTRSLGNNWVISTAANETQMSAGGVDGTMAATLAVDQVSVSNNPGDDFMLGRVVVGQIHASDDEPLRIYYRKQPHHSKLEGIALGEKWSYKVEVIGREMVVTVIKEDGSFVAQNITWAAEYDRDWFYFRAGSYNQNNGGETDEFARVSFFALDVNHN